MADKLVLEENIKSCNSEQNENADCIFCAETSSKKSFPKYFMRTPDLPYTKDLLDLASYGGIPIPNKLGAVMINLLEANITPNAIRDTLKTILDNSVTKRVPEKKKNLLKKTYTSGEDGGYIGDNVTNNDINHDAYDDVDRSHDDNGDDDSESLTSENFSTATHYLLENILYACQIDDSLSKELSSPNSPYLKQLPVTGGHGEEFHNNSESALSSYVSFMS